MSSWKRASKSLDRKQKCCGGWLTIQRFHLKSWLEHPSKRIGIGCRNNWMGGELEYQLSYLG